MQSSDPILVTQPNTDATRHAAPAGCSTFSPEQIQKLDAAFLAWEADGYSARAGEQYAATRRKEQYAAMLRSL